MPPSRIHHHDLLHLLTNPIATRPKQRDQMAVAEAQRLLVLADDTRPWPNVLQAR
jgi:hypothetical protein